MGLSDMFRPRGPQTQAEQDTAATRQADILASLPNDRVPECARLRLEGIRGGHLPWTATMTAAEFRMVRSHGLRPLAAVSSTCWLHYGYSWTRGHQQGWATALRRLQAEAAAAGANAVLDVKMRTVRLGVANSMDFTLIGTAVAADGLPPSPEPLVATVPALELVKLIEADVVPVGIAVGADYQWLNDWGNAASMRWMGNTESRELGDFWTEVRRNAHGALRLEARGRGNGVLAHVNFSQMFKFEADRDIPVRFLGRHIVIATTVDAKARTPFPHDVAMAVDIRDGPTPLTRAPRHHGSYDVNDEEGGI